jgi:hypothetical protein
MHCAAIPSNLDAPRINRFASRICAKIDFTIVCPQRQYVLHLTPFRSQRTNRNQENLQATGIKKTFARQSAIPWNQRQTTLYLQSAIPVLADRGKIASFILE